MKLVICVFLYTIKSLNNTEVVFYLVSDIVYPDLDEELAARTKPSIPSSQPIIDRGVKPDIKPSNQTFVPDPPSMKNTTDIESAVEPKKMTQAPEVNRNLKNDAVMKYLEKEEKLVERSLEMAQERLGEEEKWNQIRMEKESAINNEIRAHLQEREEEFIKRLKEMETDNKKLVSSR